MLYAIDTKKSLEELSINEFKQICDVFDDDIYEAISLETCVGKRNTIGAPGPDAMKKVIEINEEFLNKLS